MLPLRAFPRALPHSKAPGFPRKQRMSPTTLFDKIWRRHVVHGRPDGRTLLYVDRHLVQDGSAPAFAMLRARGLSPRLPERAFATPDHYVPTNSRNLADVRDPEAARMAEALRADTARAGIRFFGIEDPRQGIIHVIGPEQGLSQPGCSSSAATAIRRRMARSARSRSASERRRWRTCSPRRRSGSSARRPCASPSTERLATA